MKCFIDYIGINGCASLESQSDISINDLPGLDTNDFTSLVTNDNPTYLNVWTKIQKNAARVFQREVNTELHNRYIMKSIRGSFKTYPQYEALTSHTTSAAYLRGLILKLNDITNDNTYSIFANLYISKIHVYSFTNQTKDILVIDGYINKVLDTYEVDLVQGWNTININKNYISDSLYIVGYDLGNRPQTIILDDLSDEFMFTMQDIGGDDPYIKGIQFAGDSTDNTMTQGTDTYGVSVEFTVSCDYEAFVCSNKKTFENAWLYCLGAAVVKEAMVSKNYNLTTVDIDRLKMLEDLYLSEMVKELRLCTIGLNFDLDNCISCNHKIKSVKSLL